MASSIGLTNSHFGTANGWPDNGVTYVTARDLATLARYEIEHHYKLYKQFYSLPSFTWGKTLGSGQDITQQTATRSSAMSPGADGLKTGHTDEAGYGFTGSAEQNGRRLIEVLAGLPSWNARVQELTRLIQWGFDAWQAKPLFQAGREGRHAPRCRWAARAKCRWSPRATLRSPCPPACRAGATSMKIRYDGPLVAPIAKGQDVAELVITTGDTPPQIVPLVAGEDVGKAGFFGRIWLGLQAAVRDGVTPRGQVHQPRRRGGGRQVDAGQGARRGACAERGIDVVVTREPGGSEGAERIRELLLSGSDDRWGPQAEALLFAAARADHVEKTIRPGARSGPLGPVPTASSTARSPTRAAPAGSASRPCARSTLSASASDFPDRTLVLVWMRAAASAPARAIRDGSDRIGGRSRRLSSQGRRGVPH